MKRDNRLIFKLLAVADNVNDSLYLENFDLGDYSKKAIDYHVKLLEEEEFIRTESVRASSYSAKTNIVIQGLTWDGHEFLDAMRCCGVLDDLEKYARYPISSIAQACKKRLESEVSSIISE